MRHQMILLDDHTYILLVMQHRYWITLIVMIFACFGSKAALLYPDSETASNEVELGVEGIARICPTGLWDHLEFRDIEYDKDSATVTFVISLPNIEVHDNGNEPIEKDSKCLKEWVVKNIMAGYGDLISNSRINVDGDFILYLSLGTLLQQIEKDRVNLRIDFPKLDHVDSE